MAVGVAGGGYALLLSFSCILDQMLSRTPGKKGNKPAGLTQPWFWDSPGKERVLPLPQKPSGKLKPLTPSRSLWEGTTPYREAGHLPSTRGLTPVEMTRGTAPIFPGRGRSNIGLSATQGLRLVRRTASSLVLAAQPPRPSNFPCTRH